MDVIIELNSFIDKALRSRKYLPNVATNYRGPLKWIEPELTDEEKQSLETLKKNLNQVFNLLYSKPGNKLSADSIEVYKKRTINLIADYEKYGKDPSAMANWDRPIITRPHKSTKAKVEKEAKTSQVVLDQNIPALSFEQASSLTKHEEILSGGKAFIFTPTALAEEDIDTLQAYLNYLKTKIKKI